MPSHLSSLAAAYRKEKDNHFHPPTHLPHHHRHSGGRPMMAEHHQERTNPFLTSNKPSNHHHFSGLNLPPPPPFATSDLVMPPQSRSPPLPMHRDRISSSANKGSGMHRHHHNLKSPPSQDLSSKSMMAPPLHSSHHNHHQRPHHYDSRVAAAAAAEKSRMFSNSAIADIIKSNEFAASLENKERLSRYPAHIELDRVAASASYQRPLFLDLQDRNSRSTGVGGAAGMYPPPEMMSRHSDKSSRAPRLSPRGVGDPGNSAGLSLLRTIDHVPPPGASPYEKLTYIDMDKAGRVLPPHSAHNRHHLEQFSAERNTPSSYVPQHPFGQPHSSVGSAALLSAYNIGTSRYGGGGGGGTTRH